MDGRIATMPEILIIENPDCKNNDGAQAHLQKDCTWQDSSDSALRHDSNCSCMSPFPSPCLMMPNCSQWRSFERNPSTPACARRTQPLN